MLRAWMTGVDARVPGRSRSDAFLVVAHAAKVEGVGHVDEDQFVAACKKARPQTEMLLGTYLNAWWS